MQLFLTHSLAPPCDGLGGVPVPPVVGITASTVTPIIMPRVVKILTIVIPCSLNNVFNRSRSGVSFLRLCQ